MFFSKMVPMFDYYGEFSEKLKSEVFKILGFVFFTPGGQTILYWLDSGFVCNLLLAQKLAFSLIMIYIGYLSLNRSAYILIKLDKYTDWKKQRINHGSTN